MNSRREDRPNGITVWIALPPSMKQNARTSEVPSSIVILGEQLNTHINHISNPIPTPETMPASTATTRLPKIKLFPPKAKDENGIILPTKADTVSANHKREECERAAYFLPPRSQGSHHQVGRRTLLCPSVNPRLLCSHPERYSGMGCKANV